MKRWWDVWNSYWFPSTTTLGLGLTRIIAVAAQLVWFFPDLNANLVLVSKNDEFIDPQPLVRLISAVAGRDAVFTPDVLTALYRLTFVSGVLALVGLFTRASLLVFTFGILFFISHLYSYADYHHGEAVFSIFLVALSLAPAGRSVSLDALIRKYRSSGSKVGPVDSVVVDTAVWPLKLAHVLLSMTYFSTGATKMIDGGLQWMNGYTLQSYTFGDAIARGYPLGIWLGQQYYIAVALSVFTIVFELFFFLSIFLPRAAPLFFASGILFHIGLHLSGGHGFFQHVVLLSLLLCFLSPQWEEIWWKRASLTRMRLSLPLPGLTRSAPE